MNGKPQMIGKAEIISALEGADRILKESDQPEYALDAARYIKRNFPAQLKRRLQRETVQTEAARKVSEMSESNQLDMDLITWSKEAEEWRAAHPFTPPLTDDQRRLIMRNIDAYRYEEATSHPPSPMWKLQQRIFDETDGVIYP